MLRNVLNPRRVIVGGELAEADDLLLNPLRETLERQTMPRSAAQLRVARPSSASRRPPSAWSLCWSVASPFTRPKSDQSPGHPIGTALPMITGRRPGA